MKPIKQIEFKIFGSDAKSFRSWRVRAAHGTHFTPTAGLSEQFPFAQFHVIQVGKARYNILHTVGNA